MNSKGIDKMILDSAEAVSYNAESAEQFLEEEGIDIESYVNKGLADLNVRSAVNGNKKLNKSQSYFHRAVLAAKIAHEYHDEWTFGIVKLQKLVYLSEQVSSMRFSSDYRKQAAGPMDHKFIHSIKKEFEKQGWFAVNQVGQYRKWTFKPGENVVGYQQYYANYFGDIESDIQFLIDSFRKWKTEQVELIATLFACWLEAKNDNTLINDKVLIEKVYAWHKEKEKFTEVQIIKNIRWMEENGVYPD